MVNQSDIFNTYPDENALDTVRRDSRPSSDAGEDDAASNERRDDMDSLLKRDLGDLRAGVPHFFNTYFSRVPGLDAAHKSVFKKCMQAPNPLLTMMGGGDGHNQQTNIRYWNGLPAWSKSYLHSQKSTRRPR